MQLLHAIYYNIITLFNSQHASLPKYYLNLINCNIVMVQQLEHNCTDVNYLFMMLSVTDNYWIA